MGAGPGDGVGVSTCAGQGDGAGAYAGPGLGTGAGPWNREKTGANPRESSGCCWKEKKLGRNWDCAKRKKMKRVQETKSSLRL